MTIAERMFYILDDKGLKASELAAELGVNKSVVSMWKKRNTNPPAEMIVQICEFLDVECCFLLTGDLTMSTDELSETECELIENYRRLNRRGQHLLHSTIYDLLDQHSVADAPMEDTQQYIPFAAFGGENLSKERTELIQQALRKFEDMGPKGGET